MIRYHSRYRGSSNSGFTLLELLVSLALFAMITALAVGGISFSRRSLNAVHVRDAHEEIELFLQTLSDQISQSVPLNASHSQQNAQLLFEGRPTDIAYVRLNSGGGQRGGFVFDRVHLEPVPNSEKSNQLILSTMLYRTGTFAYNSSSNLDRLLGPDQIESLAFSYYGARSPSNAAEWSNEWLNQAHLPRLVRITVATTLKKGKREISITTRLAHSR